LSQKLLKHGYTNIILFLFFTKAYVLNNAYSTTMSHFILPLIMNLFFLAN